MTLGYWGEVFMWIGLYAVAVALVSIICLAIFMWWDS